MKFNYKRANLRRRPFAIQALISLLKMRRIDRFYGEKMVAPVVLFGLTLVPLVKPLLDPGVERIDAVASDGPACSVALETAGQSPVAFWVLSWLRCGWVDAANGNSR